MPGFREWTSFLSWIGTQTLRPLLLLSGFLILKTQFEELQLLLQGSLWPETFEHVAPLPNPNQLWCHCRCSLSAVKDKSHAVTLQIGLQHALRLKPLGHIGAARTNYWLFVMHYYHYFPERVAVLVQPEHKKVKHINCFILNVNTSFFSGWFALCWCENATADLLTFDFWLAEHVCIYGMCVSCVSVTAWGTCHVSVCTETHCERGKAIGRPGRVIKVKLLPPRLFLPVWWDNKRGSPSPLLFHTRPACLSDLSDNSNSV